MTFTTTNGNAFDGALTFEDLRNAVRVFRSHEEVMVPRPVTSYGLGELWRVVLEETCARAGLNWPWPKVRRTEPGVVMARCGASDMFAGPSTLRSLYGA